MAPSRRFSLLAAAAAFALGCTGATLNDLQRDASASADDTPSADLAAPEGDVVSSPDSGAPGADVQAPPDAVIPSTDAVTPPPVDAATPPPMDVPSPPVDVVTPRPDVVTPPDVATPPDVVTPRPDVVTPVDRPPACESCEGFAPVAFCRGSGSGACLSYAGCVDRCARCIAPTAGGDTCSSAPVISTRGRSRAVFTTCGASDNLSIGCNRGGPDIVVILRVGRAGRVTGTMTVPEGAGVFFGYERLGGQCRNESSTRACDNPTPGRTQSFDSLLTAGDYPIYIATTVPSTVVIETDLP